MNTKLICSLLVASAISASDAIPDLIGYSWSSSSAVYFGQADASYTWTVVVDSESAPSGGVSGLPWYEGTFYTPESVTLVIDGGSQGYQEISATSPLLFGVYYRSPSYDSGVSYGNYNLYLHVNVGALDSSAYNSIAYTIGTLFTEDVVTGSPPYDFPTPPQPDIVTAGTHFHLQSGTISETVSFSWQIIPEPSTGILLLLGMALGMSNLFTRKESPT